MDSFESLIKTIFENKGYWVQTSFKVNLSKEEKQKIGRPSSPRWELDVVAYKGGSKEILVIECKSYLDSPGVKAESFKDGRYNERYKLFNEQILQNIVFDRMKNQLVDTGACAPDTKIKLCLATGKIASGNDRAELEKIFKDKAWGLFTDEWIKKELIKLSNSGYENEVAMVVTKILTRQ
ncbi:MAG: hypothetical protein HOD92_18625 [Deltaproteobacteria bacterium]|jgi:hypothetical protein|nr:hypothetical protein [Deltaproteobacteria bacterium]MBT4483438.1 hypothetical protein [Candidatus Latescibacterota bacterium]